METDVLENIEVLYCFNEGSIETDKSFLETLLHFSFSSEEPQQYWSFIGILFS